MKPLICAMVVGAVSGALAAHLGYKWNSGGNLAILVLALSAHYLGRWVGQ